MLTTDYLPYAIPFFVLAILMESIWTRRARKRQYHSIDAITCIATGILSMIVGIFAGGFIWFSYNYIYDHYRIFDMLNFSDSLQIASWLLLIVLQDFFYYWFHRFAHEINLLWASHVTHHSSEEYNLAVAVRQSSTQQFFSWPLYLPLALAGFPPAWVVSVMSINLIYQFWFHTREINKMPAWFELIFNTPSHHRVHHGTNDQYLDKNYGGIFIIWDKLFGTFEPEIEVPRYGITTPIKSYNPVWLNLHYYWQLWQTSRIAPSLQQAILLLLAAPGWTPDWQNDQTLTIED